MRVSACLNIRVSQLVGSPSIASKGLLIPWFPAPISSLYSGLRLLIHPHIVHLDAARKHVVVYDHIACPVAANR